MPFDGATIFVTGGAGFIGSAVVRHLLDYGGVQVVNIDKLTYAANLASIPQAEGHPRYALAKVDICDAAALRALFERHQPDAVMNLAAESHVDRSIDAPAAFIETNIEGTFTLLKEALHYWRSLEGRRRAAFRLYNVGGRSERTNIDVVRMICDLLDRMEPAAGGSRCRLIRFVNDRPGHDRRYAIDPTKIETELGWRARETFETGLDKTVKWFLDNRAWWRDVLDSGYRAQRIGVFQVP